MDDFHVRPDRVAHAVATFISGDAELTLTPRTARLRVSGLGCLPDLSLWHGRMAQVMDSLYLGVQRGARGECQLPPPVRTEIRETTPSA
ncbi:hypothetical protein KMT30_07815 [Streptomyces sp. IBSBF 2953]|nr:hypothetical protein [Streptomyces hayashii]